MNVGVTEILHHSRCLTHNLEKKAPLFCFTKEYLKTAFILKLDDHYIKTMYSIVRIKVWYLHHLSNSSSTHQQRKRNGQDNATHGKVL